jgi:hypothetical protein
MSAPQFLHHNLGQRPAQAFAKGGLQRCLRRDDGVEHGRGQHAYTSMTHFIFDSIQSMAPPVGA